MVSSAIRYQWIGRGREIAKNEDSLKHYIWCGAVVQNQRPNFAQAPQSRLISSSTSHEVEWISRKHYYLQLDFNKLPWRLSVRFWRHFCVFKSLLQAGSLEVDAFQDHDQGGVFDIYAVAWDDLWKAESAFWQHLVPYYKAVSIPEHDLKAVAALVSKNK